MDSDEESSGDRSFPVCVRGRQGPDGGQVAPVAAGNGQRAGAGPQGGSEDVTGLEDLAQLQRGRGYPWERCPELADLVGGTTPGRTDPNQLTMFMNNFGVGIQFAALGARAWQQAQERGLGQHVPSEWFLQDIQP